MDYEMEPQGDNKKKIIIGVVIGAAVIGLVVAVVLVLRSRSGVGELLPGGVNQTNDAVPGATDEPGMSQRPPSQLLIRACTDGPKVVPLTIRSFTDGTPVLGSPIDMNGAEKASLGAPAEARVTLSLTRAPRRTGLVAEIAVGKAVSDPEADASPQERAVTLLNVPTGADGLPSFGVSRTLTVEEKRSLGLPDKVAVALMVKRSGKDSSVLEVTVDPVAAPDGVNCGQPALAATAVGSTGGDVIPISSGMDRPLTTEEKIKYGWDPGMEISIHSTSPTDGSEPEVTFSSPNWPTLDPKLMPHHGRDEGFTPGED